VRSSLAERARRELGWQPLHPKLEEIIVSAAAWMDRYPEGYGSQEKGAP
jgi:UDP-glucose 4-epimerase